MKRNKLTEGWADCTIYATSYHMMRRVYVIKGGRSVVQGYGPVIIVPSSFAEVGRVFLMTVMILCCTPAAVDSADGFNAKEE